MIDEKGHTVSQWVKEKGNQAVDSVDAAGTYAINFIKNPQEEGQKLINKAGEGIHNRWEWLKKNTIKNANWVQENVNWVSAKVNQNIIQPVTNGVQQGWNRVQGWMESTFPGLTRCWKVFQEYSGVIAGYIKQKSEQAGNWVAETNKKVSPWVHGTLDAIGLAAPMIGGAIGSVVPGAGNLVGAAVGETIATGADVINAVWYLAEGDWGNAALSGFSALPIVGYLGNLTKSGKHAFKNSKYLDDIAKLISRYGDNVVELFTKYSDKILPLLKNLLNWLNLYSKIRTLLKFYLKIRMML